MLLKVQLFSINVVIRKATLIFCTPLNVNNLKITNKNVIKSGKKIKNNVIL